MNRPLQVDIRVAGKLLGLKSVSSAYRHVPDLVSCIHLNKNRSVVPAQALANKLGVTLEVLWEAVERATADKSPDQEEAEERAAAAAKADKGRQRYIDQLIANEPAGLALERAKAKGVQA